MRRLQTITEVNFCREMILIFLQKKKKKVVEVFKRIIKKRK